MKSPIIALSSLMLAAFIVQGATVVSIPTSGNFANNTTTNAPAIERSLNLSGMNTSADTNNPATWLQSQGSWTQDFQAAVMDSGTSINNKIGWVAYNLGSALSSLGTFYIWNCAESTAGNRDVQDFNIYYATTPTGLASNADYNFASAGWTKLNGSTLTMSKLSSTSGPQASINLGGITAQYIAIEVLSNYGDTGRWGIAEVALTQIPEPSIALLGGLGLLTLLRRRTR